MTMTVGKEVVALTRMTVGDLRRKYAEAFGEATNARHKEWLVRRIAWRLQAVAEGDISERARQRAAELARDADLRIKAPKPVPPVADPAAVVVTGTIEVPASDRLPVPGTIIMRQYKGQTYQVQVLPHGFDFEGQVYKSLSAVAKAITGQHCNGYYFFRLGRHGGAE
jgi:hypothetical protein